MQAACCGHGIIELGVETGTGLIGWTTCYVFFSDGPTLYGNAAKAALEMLGGRPPRIPPIFWPATPILDRITCEGGRP